MIKEQYVRDKNEVKISVLSSPDVVRGVFGTLASLVGLALLLVLFKTDKTTW